MRPIPKTSAVRSSAQPSCLRRHRSSLRIHHETRRRARQSHFTDFASTCTARLATVTARDHDCEPHALIRGADLTDKSAAD